MMALHWYAARTKSMTEYSVRNRLESVGIEAFLPCIRSPRPRLGHQDAPLFPGYLFLHYDLEGRGWRPLRQVSQLVGLTAFDGVVPPVPDEVIDELAERVSAINGEGGFWQRFNVGDRVRVDLASVEHLAQVVNEPRSPQDRVRLLVDFLGRLIYAEVPWQQVWPLGVAAPLGTQDFRAPRRTRGKGRWISGYGPRGPESIGATPPRPDNERPSS